VFFVDKKTKGLKMIKNEKDANKAGLSFVTGEAKIKEIEAHRDRQIAEIRAEAGEKIKALEATGGRILQDIGEWFWANPDSRDPATKGQLTLTNVLLQERTTTSLKYPSPLQKVIDAAKKLGFERFIRIKEELAKDLIRAEATPDQLKALGIKSEDESSVYVTAI